MFILLLDAWQKITDSRIVRAFLQDEYLSAELQADFITASLRE
jgi:hypothetical protein